MSQDPFSWRERVGLVVALVGFACFGISWVVLLGPRSSPNSGAYAPMGAGILIAAVGGLIFRGGNKGGGDHGARPRGDDRSDGDH